MKKIIGWTIAILILCLIGWRVYVFFNTRTTEPPAQTVVFQGCGCGNKTPHRKAARHIVSHKKPAVVVTKKEQPAPKPATAPVATPAIQRPAPVVASTLLEGVDTNYPKKVVTPSPPKVEQTKVVVVAIQAPPVYNECDSSRIYTSGRCFNGTVYSSGYSYNTGYTGVNTYVQPYAPQPFVPIPVPHPQSHLNGYTGGNGGQPPSGHLGGRTGT